MDQLIKVQFISLPKLNNNEYTNLMERTAEEILIATPEKLGITPEHLAKLQANILKMQELVAASRISDDTAKLAELDDERDNTFLYIMGEIENKLRSPMANVREAATSLHNATKHFVGIQKKPDQQETQELIGILLELDKSSNAANATTLGLNDAIEYLRQTNDEFAKITARRTNYKVAEKIDSSATIRPENDAVYDYITTMAFVSSVSSPSEEATLFIKQMNALIQETETRYNQRKAAKKSEEDDKEKKPTADSDNESKVPEVE